jgi:hypothetical protein
MQSIILHVSLLTDDQVLECTCKQFYEIRSYPLYNLFVLTLELSASPEEFDGMSALSQEQGGILRAPKDRRCKVDSYEFDDLRSDDDKASEDSGANESSENEEDSAADESSENEEDLGFVSQDESGRSEEEYCSCDSSSDGSSDGSELDYDVSDVSSNELSDESSDEYGGSEVPSRAGKMDRAKLNETDPTPSANNCTITQRVLSKRCTSGAKFLW